MHPCFGFSALGMCTYNPAQPTLTYFTIGDAVAALAFTLAVQQLFKPIYVFRLRAHRLKIAHLIAAIFLGALCAIVAMMIPNLPIADAGPLRYPVFWELLGGVLITSAYAVTAFISLRPARVYSFNMIAFARAGAELLSAANEEDRVAFAEDLLQAKNIKQLVKIASALEMAEMRSVHVEFERLRSIGEPQQIRGRVPISAFYIFAHRDELELASYAHSFLRILSDPDFCSVLVRKCPWLTAAALERLCDPRLNSESIRPFVQAIASQAVLQEQSMMTKEVSYTGFATAPLLSSNLFGNWRMLSRYDPLGGLDFSVPEAPSEAFVRRLNTAGEMMLKTAMDHGDYWPQQYMFSLERVYESLCRHWALLRTRSVRPEFAMHLHLGINRLTRTLSEGLASLDWDRKKALFVLEPDKFQNDLVGAIANIIYESLECLSHDFDGWRDPSWIDAIAIFRQAFPAYGNEIEGLNPLQQQLALKLVAKLEENMRGLYPPVSRLLLAILGPYAEHAVSAKRTAYIILKDAVYKKLQRLCELYKEKPDKIADFLPADVRYDPAANVLIHTYRSGKETITDLSSLDIPAIDLTDESSWRKP